MTSEKQDRILEMVRKQLQRTNPPNTKALYARAARIDEGIRGLTLRQFNARYPLQVRREMAREKKEQGRGDARESDDNVGKSIDGIRDEERRAAIRDVLFDFAREVVETPAGRDLVDLVGMKVEEYVSRLVRAKSA